jgi:broad-specificity NMP kinase
MKRLEALTDEAAVIHRMIVDDLEAELRRRGFTEAQLLANAKAELLKRYGA